MPLATIRELFIVILFLFRMVFLAKGEFVVKKKTQLDAKCSLVTDIESTKKRRMLDTITNDYLCAPARVSMAYVGI